MGRSHPHGAYCPGPDGMRMWAVGVRGKLGPGWAQAPLPCPRRGHRVPRNSSGDSRNSSSIFTLPGLTFCLAFLAGGTGF